MQWIAANRLARVCAFSAQAPEWEQFVRLVSPVIALAARRVSEAWGETSDGAVSEIVQEVFLKLCEDERRILREFEDRGHHSFLKLLRTIAATVGTDHFRRRHTEKRGGMGRSAGWQPRELTDDVLDDAAGAAMEWPSLIAQVDALLRLHPKSISPRDRTLFWLHYRHGMTAQAISRIPAMGLTDKGVESALFRIRRILRETIARGQRQPGFFEKKVQSLAKVKGFSSAIAIDSVKRR